jgi:hypothetical protein
MASLLLMPSIVVPVNPNYPDHHQTMEPGAMAFLLLMPSVVVRVNPNYLDHHPPTGHYA